MGFIPFIRVAHANRLVPWVGSPQILVTSIGTGVCSQYAVMET